MYLYMCSFLETKSVALCERATAAGQKERDAARIGTPLILSFTFVQSEVVWVCTHQRICCPNFPQTHPLYTYRS